jgi:hypothetical protein
MDEVWCSICERIVDPYCPFSDMGPVCPICWGEDFSEYDDIEQ